MKWERWDKYDVLKFEMPSLASKCPDWVSNVSCFCQHFVVILQGSYGSWKTWKVLKFYCGISRSGKSWKRATGPGKCWTFVKLKWENWNVWQTGRRINNEILGLQGLVWILESWKSPGNLFWEKGTNPVSRGKGLYMHIDTGRGQFLWRSLRCAVFFCHFVCWTLNSAKLQMFDDQSHAMFDTQLELMVYVLWKTQI